MIDFLWSFGKYLAASSELFNIKIKGVQATFVQTLLNFKKRFCIVLLIQSEKAFL